VTLKSGLEVTAQDHIYNSPSSRIRTAAERL